MGLGSFGPIELSKKLTGKVARLNAFITEREEGVRGSASPKDLETWFQLNYLAFTAPHYDQQAFESMKSRFQGVLENQKASPGYWYEKRRLKELFGDHPRRQMLEAEDLDRLDPQEALRFYRQRFADASGFTYFVVGSFTLDQIRPLVEKWLASLPSEGREETWRDVDAYAKPGKRSFEVRKGLEPRAQVQVIWFGDAEWSLERATIASAVGQALRLRLREVLREDLGGVYSVGVSTGIGRYPRGRYSARISFGADPERVDELLAATRAEIAAFQAEGPPQEIIDKVKESWRRGRETQLEQNGFWVGVLQRYVSDELPWEEFANFERRLELLTPEAIRDYSRLLFDDSGTVEGRLVPEVEGADGESGEARDGE